MIRVKFWALLIPILLVLNTNSQKAIAQGNYDSRYDNQYDDYGASYQDFYDGLAPYGQWLNDPMYGYVWLPNVGPDFRPYYTNGYWVMTEYGNTWISNYDWGWAPFHYGRWTFDNYYGWLWIPDTQWAPAWVSWRSNNNYYGWAPMGPGVNINISLGSIPVDWWVFLSPRYFYEPRFHRYCNNDWRFNRGIYNQTTYINYTYNDRRTVYYTGPRADDYRRRTGRQSSMFHISNNNRRGANSVRGNTVSLYRPRVRQMDNNAPRKIVQADRRVSERPQTFVGNNQQLEGRQKVLRQNPVVNNREQSQENRMKTPNQRAIQIQQQRSRTDDQIRTNVREQQIQNTRPSNTQYEQERNKMMQERMNQESVRQQQEKQRMQQDNIRQQQLEQRDNLMREQRNREQDRQRSIQTEESNRQRMQQMRDAQEQRQRMQQSAQREQQINRPSREAQPIQQMNRPQRMEPIREQKPAFENQRIHQDAPTNSDRQSERFRGRQ